MIHVIASIEIDTGQIPAALEIYKGFVPQVLAEEGCIEYRPTVDIDAHVGTQVRDADVITVIEKWDSMAAFKAHLNAPHVLAYREATKGIVASVSIKVLVDALVDAE